MASRINAPRFFVTPLRGGLMSKGGGRKVHAYCTVFFIKIFCFNETPFSSLHLASSGPLSRASTPRILVDLATRAKHIGRTGFPRVLWSLRNCLSLLGVGGRRIPGDRIQRFARRIVDWVMGLLMVLRERERERVREREKIVDWVMGLLMVLRDTERGERVRERK